MIQLLRAFRYIGPGAQLLIYFLQLMGLLAFGLIVAMLLGFNPIAWIAGVLWSLAEWLIEAVFF